MCFYEIKSILFKDHFIFARTMLMYHGATKINMLIIDPTHTIEVDTISRQFF